VAALHQGAPGQMTWLEDPPPWLRPAYCFSSVIVWTANKNVTISQISGRFICFILTLTVKQSAKTLSFSASRTHFANFNAAIFKKVLKLRGNSRRYAYTCTNIMLCVYNSFYASLSYETAKSINVKKLQNFCQLVHNWRPTKNSVWSAYYCWTTFKLMEFAAIL